MPSISIKRRLHKKLKKKTFWALSRRSHGKSVDQSLRKKLIKLEKVSFVWNIKDVDCSIDGYCILTCNLIFIRLLPLLAVQQNRCNSIGSPKSTVHLLSKIPINMKAEISKKKPSIVKQTSWKSSFRQKNGFQTDKGNLVLQLQVTLVMAYF